MSKPRATLAALAPLAVALALGGCRADRPAYARERVGRDGGAAARRVRPEREARAAVGRMAKLEEQVAVLERRRAELEKRLVDPQLWSDAAAASAVVDELSAVQREIEAATARWEELAATT
jgi:hypothetical protein